MLLGYSTEEVIYPDWEEELQESGSTQWRVFAGEETQIVPKAGRVGDLIALGDGTMVQTDVEGYLGGTYPVFMGRSKLVSREQFRVPGGRDSISSPALSSTPSCADADVCAAAAIQGNSGTILTSGQEAGLSEKNNPQPTAIGSCGYAHFEGDIPPETAEKASRRIEHAGSTPPPTPTQDSDVISDEVTEHTAHEDSSVSYEYDASYGRKKRTCETRDADADKRDTNTENKNGNTTKKQDAGIINGVHTSNNTDGRRSCVFVLCAAFVCLPYANAGECIARHANTNAPGKLSVHFFVIGLLFRLSDEE
jgi:hypothetical protein